MNSRSRQSGGQKSTPLWLLPLKIIIWPFVALWHFLYKHWISYLISRVLRDENRIYSIKFIWYGDTVYLHPLVWGSLVLFFVTKSGVFTAGWPLLAWFVLLSVCFLTVMYNFDILKSAVLLVAVIAVAALAYISKLKFDWNPLNWLYGKVQQLDVSVEPGFYVAAASVFALLICGELLWAWLFHRVEIDESYVYERRFLQGTTREPIFARGLKRETKDLLELLILGAADIQHRTKNGYKRFKNVPGASLGLGSAIDSMLDYRRRGQIQMEKARRDDSDDVRVEDAFPDVHEDEGIEDGNLDGEDLS
jgi:hypothetical protein